MLVMIPLWDDSDENIHKEKCKGGHSMFKTSRGLKANLMPCLCIIPSLY